MATGAEAVCVVCGEPAHSKCSACKLNTSLRHYCGKDCQVKDWPTHKKACKDIQNADLEKKLTRVANIAQQGYYDFRKNTWDIPIVKVDRLGNNDLVLYISIPLSASRARYIIEFPQHLVSDKLTENAMLCAFVRSEPAAWMYSMIGELTKGLDVKIEEIRVVLKPHLQKVIPRIIYDVDSQGYPGLQPEHKHEIFRVTSMRTKKVWVIDISGAQFDIHRAMWTWKEYQSRFTQEVDQVFPFGTHKAALKKASELQGNPTLTCGVAGKIAEHLASAVNNDWHAASDCTLSQMVALVQEHFNKVKLDLLKFMDDAVRIFVRTNSFQAEYKAAIAYELDHPVLSKRRTEEVLNAFFASVAHSETV